MDTAALAFPRFTVDRWLRECCYGDLDGSPAAAVLPARPSHVDVPWPGGESYRDVVTRTASLLDGLSTRDGPILLIGHSATRIALDHLLAGIPLDAAVADTPWQLGWEYAL